MWAVVLLCVVAVVTGSPLASVEYDVIVVGQGPSGIMAAAKLSKAGKRVLALEALDRIGGRVCTVSFGKSIVELGAEWIHGSENSLSYQLGIQNNVTLVPQENSASIHRSDGSVVNYEIAEDLIKFAINSQEITVEVAEPLGQYETRNIREYIKTKYPALDKDFIENFLILMEEITNNYDGSNSWNDSNTISHYESLGGNQEISWGRQGYETLFDIILIQAVANAMWIFLWWADPHQLILIRRAPKTLAGCNWLQNKYKHGPGLPSLTVKLNTEVVQIKWPKDSSGPVEVTTKDGTVYKAEAVIVTVSLGVLKERHSTLFTPPLPEDKVHAIEVIAFGVVDKVILRFPYKWMNVTYLGFLWKTEDVDKLPESDKWLTRGKGITVPLSCEACGTYWITGDRAKLIETMPEEELKMKIMSVIRQFVGPNVTVPDPVEMIRSTWYTNPFTRGSYSFEGLLTPENPDARKDLGKPLVDAAGKPRVLFAGEATNLNHFSTVHGALETGVREASRLEPLVAAAI